MMVTETRDHGTAYITLDGELDMSNQAELAAALKRALTAQAIIVDCAGVSFCGSSGIHALWQGHMDAQAVGITLRLVGVRGLMRRVLKVCGLLPILTGEGLD
jgi:anti-sigma B factor antagonist